MNDKTLIPQIVTVAYKEYTKRGRCLAHWHRLVWRDGEWVYPGHRRLASNDYPPLARWDYVEAKVWPGEIVADYSPGEPVSAMYLVPEDTEPELVELSFRRNDGVIEVVLPNGTVLTLPDPRP